MMMPTALASPVPARLNRRAAERRHSIASLVEAITRGLVAGREPAIDAAPYAPDRGVVASVH